MVLLLLLCTTFTYAARPEPAFANHTPEKTQLEDEVVVKESCEGVGEEDCLMRRNLAIHLDYVYTQKHKQP
ncbi:hypothetical protein SLEP1_g8350 [Rubroshorea leprosula]|uniref:Phytosulfokine n=1 Tax=Rubroshorea leprosula TaxID=152421 RepID=A0AAV5ICF9_9ROSI|nr:hypothetical protein SLEP1_g8350 [Rubroshorea leprosula]